MELTSHGGKQLAYLSIGIVTNLGRCRYCCGRGCGRGCCDCYCLCLWLWLLVVAAAAAAAARVLLVAFVIGFVALSLLLPRLLLLLSASMRRTKKAGLGSSWEPERKRR